jgi:hypothetical protein
MSKFYIQSGYQGKEVGALLFLYSKESFKYSARDEYNGEIAVGSVEFVEEYIGQRTPNYYPDFLKSYFHREIWRTNTLPEGDGIGIPMVFAKPADRHKRFEAQITSMPYKGSCITWGNKVHEYHKGPFWCSEIVQFKEEWRYYVAEGNIFYAGWYLGEEKETDAPKLNIDWPKDFCGAVDFGRLSTGEIALVENNLPYACGWYGPYSDGIIYAEWLEKGWNYLTKE